jgi:hypothetical protein
MAVAVKTQLQIQSLVIMMFWHTKKDESGKITGYVVDLSTTFDADVQTFH